MLNFFSSVSRTVCRDSIIQRRNLELFIITMVLQKLHYDMFVKICCAIECKIKVTIFVCLFAPSNMHIAYFGMHGSVFKGRALKTFGHDGSRT